MSLISEFNSEFECDTEEQTFPPPSSMIKSSHLQSLQHYQELYDSSIKDPVSVWATFLDDFYWHKKPTTKNFLNYKFSKNDPKLNWLSDGYTNISYNCVDVHVNNGFGDWIAFDWIANDYDVKGGTLGDDNVSNKNQKVIQYTYKRLYDEVCHLSKALLAYGIEKGDVVAIYTGMVPETIVAMLACARIGAVHMVVFGGYSAEALAVRLIDSRARILLTIDACFRGSKLIEMEKIAEWAVFLSHHGHGNVEMKGELLQKHNVERIIVKAHLNRFAKATLAEKRIQDASKYIQGHEPSSEFEAIEKEDFDVEYKNVFEYTKPLKMCYDLFLKSATGKGNDSDEVAPCWLPADHNLFILHTSGSTGKPKGIVHSSASYMLYSAATFKFTFNCVADDVFFCTGDLGWITGHTYNCYAPLLCKRRFVMLEGILLYPDPGFCWRICDQYKVSHLYTAPTAVRALMKYGDEPVIGVVGEPISCNAWNWLYNVVGKEKCAIVDTYFLTEAGGHLITTLPGVHRMKPGSAGLPFFGVAPAIVDEEGNELKNNDGSVEGYLVFKAPWPGMMRKIHGLSNEQYGEKYFSKFGGKYFFTGDGAIRDRDGYYWITGRVDDMMNCSGHLLSSKEIENVLASDKSVAECAVVAISHAIKGQSPYAFLVLRDFEKLSQNELITKSKHAINLVRTQIGPFAAPDKVIFVASLPKTRSGKIMRRILRHICVQNYNFGDVSSLCEPEKLETMIAQVNSQVFVQPRTDDEC